MSHGRTPSSSPVRAPVSRWSLTSAAIGRVSVGQAVEGLACLTALPEAIQLAAEHVREGATPADDADDAYHLAFAPG